MPGKLPLRIDFERALQRPIATQSAARGLEGVNARVVGKLTGAFVDQFERERNLETPTPQFVSAVIAANANILAGLIRYCIEGNQRQALDVVLKTIQQQVAPRLDASASAPAFYPGFDPHAERRLARGEEK